SAPHVLRRKRRLRDEPGRRTRRAGRRRPGYRSRSEELRLGHGSDADVRATKLRDRAPSRRALDEAQLQEIRLVHVLDRLLLLAERRGERREPDGAAFELDRNRAQELARLAIESLLVDLEQVQRLARDLVRDRALVPHLRDVAHAAEDAVRNARGAARAARDL